MPARLYTLNRNVPRVPAHTADLGRYDDTIAGIEEFDGTRFADQMRGGAANEIFLGEAGPDVIRGGRGRDIISRRGTTTA
jgi:hypothetical protein